MPDPSPHPLRALLVICSLSLCVLADLDQARAAGPSWLAELSDPTAHEVKADSIEVRTPAQTFVTVGVYETSSLDVQAPPSIGADVYLIRHVRRTVFKLGYGFSKARQVGYRGVPYRTRDELAGDEWTGPMPWFLSPPDMHDRSTEDPQTSWGVRLKCGKAGTYEVPIACEQNTVTVTLHVGEPVPQSDCGFGFYFEQSLHRYPQNLHMQMEQLRDYGCNTVALQIPAKTAEEQYVVTAQTLDHGVAIGLFDKDVPVILMAGIEGARRHGRRVADWPQLIKYAPDEPPPQFIGYVRNVCVEARALGLLTGTAISPASAFLYGDMLDAWIVPVQYQSQLLRVKARRDGARWWTYTTGLRGSNAPLNRYHSGVWTWKTRQRGNLAWVYMDHSNLAVHEDGSWQLRFVDGEMFMWSRALASPKGPIATVGLAGFRDGTVDYRILRELDRAIERNPGHEKVGDIVYWMQNLRDRMPSRLDTGGSFDVSDTMMPPVDCVAVRRQALDFISELTE